jgi:hypothetical protein
MASAVYGEHENLVGYNGSQPVVDELAPGSQNST